MGLDDFEASAVAGGNIRTTFLVFTLLRTADTAQIRHLLQAYPEIVSEYIARLGSPDGRLETDPKEDDNGD